MANHPATANPLARLSKRSRVLLIALLGLLFMTVYVVGPQLSIFNDVGSVLQQADKSRLGVAIGLLLASFAAASGVYMALVWPKLRLGPTYVVQMAGSFAGRILPLGLGSVSVSYLYLRRQNLGKVWAGGVVALNNLLGYVGHLSLLLVIVAASAVNGPLRQVTFNPWLGAVAAAVVGGLVIGAVVMSRLRRRSFRQLRQQVRALGRRPQLLVVALVCSVLITFSNVLILSVSVSAIGAHIDLLAAILILSAGLLAQSATPTPGGLGGVEAGLVAGLVSAHLPLDQAVAAALIFRLVTYWVPLVVGSMAFAVALRRRYV